MIPEELSIQSIEKVYKKIKPFINVTPLIKANQIVDYDLNTNVYLKYECFQKSGSFKARGAINNILSADKKDLANGITAVSAGNHAIAASYAANIFNLKNKIFLYESANPYRVTQCENYNANILFTNKNKAFDENTFQRIFQMNLKDNTSDPYRILDVKRENSDQEIRKKWIQLNKEHHPDNLIAKGMPKEFINQSNKELAAINIAYDKIKEIRGIS